MHTRQQFAGIFPDPAQYGHLVVVATLVQTLVALPAVGMDRAARLKRVPYERVQTGRRGVWYNSHADASDAASIRLCQYHDEYLIPMLPPS